MCTLMDSLPYLSHTTASASCTIMYEIHPMLQSHPSPLHSLQLYYSISKCFCHSLMIMYPLTLPCQEHQFIEVLGQVSPIRICHHPYHPNNTLESTVLHHSSQMQHLV